MHKSATKCNETIGKWCKNKHGASKIIDTLETYQVLRAKYYPDADILKAGPKSGSSYTWQIILAGLNTFVRGYIW
jgi:hypothetical protein